MITIASFCLSYCALLIKNGALPRVTSFRFQKSNPTNPFAASILLLRTLQVRKISILALVECSAASKFGVATPSSRGSAIVSCSRLGVISGRWSAVDRVPCQYGGLRWDSVDLLLSRCAIGICSPKSRNLAGRKLPGTNTLNHDDMKPFVPYNAMDNCSCG